ncbi:casein kinase substrate phosphoprotein PP28-domain-containing protein [Mycena galopus ATCC 62051]|nr:casein kinase substrate phosphoprotein PP28-domain-containing protein [Mycena galopus ATCC 62051]
MVRGSGKFKQKRGGGRNFSKNMVLDENGTAVSTDKRWAKKGEDDSDDDSDEEEESSEEESSEEEPAPAGGSSATAQPEMSRTERRELKKKQAAAKAGKKVGADGEEEDDDEDLINPNHVTKKLNISDLGATRELSRREREQKEKQEAKDRYWKLHLEGKTDQAKADLGRLAKIRAEREAAAAKRKAETEGSSRLLSSVATPLI